MIPFLAAVHEELNPHTELCKPSHLCDIYTELGPQGALLETSTVLPKAQWDAFRMWAGKETRAGVLELL